MAQKEKTGMSKEIQERIQICNLESCSKYVPASVPHMLFFSFLFSFLPFNFAHHEFIHFFIY